MKKLFKIMMFPVRIIETLLMSMVMIILIPIATIYNMCYGVTPYETIESLWFAIQLHMEENEEES